MAETDDVSFARRALAALDLTDLGDSTHEDAADALCAKALTPHGPVAAVCLWPQFVQRAASRLKGTGVRVATVVNFPAGGEDVERMLDDLRETLADGADEIDLVIPWRALAEGREQAVADMLRWAREETGERTLKAILETGALASPALIAEASRIAIENGADFLKTSTGKTPVSATPEAARIMLEAIRASGRPVGFKASGGVRTLADARTYLTLADDMMGAGWAIPQRFRIGASGLRDALLATLDGKA